MRWLHYLLTELENIFDNRFIACFLFSLSTLQWLLMLFAKNCDSLRRGTQAIALFAGLLGILSSCSDSVPNTSQGQASKGNEAIAPGSGTLKFVANGEDFVRQGFVTKDQWQITFDHVYVTLDQVQTVARAVVSKDNATNSEAENSVVQLKQPITVDLAMGDENADPIVLDSVSAPTGQYNNLAWNLVPAATGPAQGASLLLQGNAIKQGQTLPFMLKLDPKLQFKCGDFVGEERKGILEPDSTAELEATFHFDHIFGDSEVSSDEEINQGALGFEPFAQLSQGGKVELDWTNSTTTQKLPAEQTNQLQTLLSSLGHVGEGHCEAKTL